MGEVFRRAVEALKSLPDAERERLSWEIIQRIENKNRWDDLVKAPGARAWMRDSAREALARFKKISKRLGYSQISLPVDNLVREESYWETFDRLPPDIRALAEENFHLWQKSHDHPRLRFKQVMDDPEVFSFRVGLNHRTLGVRTPNNRIAWFWVGSLDDFARMTGQQEKTQS